VTCTVSIIIQLSNICIPITVSQGLQLCNSIKMGTKFKEVEINSRNGFVYLQLLYLAMAIEEVS